MSLIPWSNRTVDNEIRRLESDRNYAIRRGNRAAARQYQKEAQRIRNNRAWIRKHRRWI